MRRRSKAWLAVVAGTGLMHGILTAADDEAGKILRPADQSWYEKAEVDLVATAPSGILTLDGNVVKPEQTFPNVFHAVLKPSSGMHAIVLLWDGGRKEVRFFVGPNAPSGYRPFHQHPPVTGVECTECHLLNTRGRLVAKPACFDCHSRDGFARVHSHQPDVLERCGTCHNAHGSNVKAHLLYSKETACRICHNN